MTYPSVFSTPGLAGFADKVDQERRRQLDKWGDQHHPDGTDTELSIVADHVRAENDARAETDALTWRDILGEEVIEAFAEEEPGPLKTELIQCAAVIQAWISDIDSREVKA